MASYPNINKSLATTAYNVTRKTGRGVNHIVVHYTGTDASAANNCKYFAGGNRNASADYFIDRDGSIYQYNADPRNYYSWHCGDGNGKYGITNPASIGIEVVSSGAEYTQAQKNSLRSLVLALMSDWNVPASRVVRHYDASRKLCPAPYCGNATKDAKWNELKTYITSNQEVPEVITDQDVERIAHAAALKVADWMVPMDGTPGKNDQPAWQHLSWAHSDGAYNRTIIDKIHKELHTTYELSDKVHNELHNTYELLDKVHNELHNTYNLLDEVKKTLNKTDSKETKETK